MTPSGPIPDELLRFVDSHVESIEHLEILRILGESQDKAWTADELARAAQIQPTAIGTHLAVLEERGLVKTDGTPGERTCRYGPRSAELARLLEELLRFYKERPVTLIKLVYARAQDQLKAFAESFRLRKER